MSWSHYHDGTLTVHTDVFSCNFPGATDFPPAESHEFIGEIANVPPTPVTYNEPPVPDEWYISISTRVKGTPWADQLYWKFLDFSKELRPGVLEYVSVTSSKVGEEEDEVEEPAEYHDENTLVKVRAAIQEALEKGSSSAYQDTLDIITSMQNYGILFRERR